MCEMVLKYHAVGLADDRRRIDWPITQSEMGDALGLSLVHVNRTLQQLRGAGLITLKDSVLIVHDWEGLRRAGMFDSLYLHLKSDGHRDPREDGARRPDGPMRPPAASAQRAPPPRT